MKFFETIRIENGIPQHLSWHQERMNLTRKNILGLNKPIHIQDHLHDLPSKDLYRAKMIYDQNSIKTYYYIYKPKQIRTLKLIEAHISYEYKALDRKHLDSLRREANDYDDILIIKNGYLTDTSIANIALRQENIWYTPTAPLLPGTTRARLLTNGTILPKQIHYTELNNYHEIALMNAMIGFSIQKEISLISDF